MDVLFKQEQHAISPRQEAFYMRNKAIHLEKDVVKFENYDDDERKVIYIKSPLLEKDNYRVEHVGARIILTISEKRTIERSVYLNSVSINSKGFNAYERLRSFDYLLPENYYVHLETKWNAVENRIEVLFK